MALAKYRPKPKAKVKVARLNSDHRLNMVPQTLGSVRLGPLVP